MVATPAQQAMERECVRKTVRQAEEPFPVDLESSLPARPLSTAARKSEQITPGQKMRRGFQYGVQDVC